MLYELYTLVDKLQFSLICTVPHSGDRFAPDEVLPSIQDALKMAVPWWR
jgi:hypothetical protein